MGGRSEDGWRAGERGSGGWESLSLLCGQRRRRDVVGRTRSFLRDQQILLASLSLMMLPRLISHSFLYLRSYLFSLCGHYCVPPYRTNCFNLLCTAMQYPILKRPGTHCLGCITVKGRQTQPEHMCFLPPPWPLSQDSFETRDLGRSPSRPGPLLARLFLLSFPPSLPLSLSPSLSFWKMIIGVLERYSRRLLRRRRRRLRHLRRDACAVCRDTRRAGGGKEGRGRGARVARGRSVGHTPGRFIVA